MVPGAKDQEWTRVDRVVRRRVLSSFLIWSLEAEGFVIPTGSMATTLMGRHKEISCPQCGYVYTVNADREVEQTAGSLDRAGGSTRGPARIVDSNPRSSDAPSFSGDRIYVMKNGLSLPFLANQGRVELKRWDVVVFKLPEEPEIRYIKRLVGMPNEVIRIEGGDVWARPQDQPGFERLRRPLDHQQAMQLMVYDDAHRPPRSLTIPAGCAGRPRGPGEWTETAPGRFVAEEHARDWNELVYHHVVPTPAQWEAIRERRCHCRRAPSDLDHGF